MMRGAGSVLEDTWHEEVGIVEVNHIIVSRRVQKCIGVVAVVIR